MSWWKEANHRENQLEIRQNRALQFLGLPASATRNQVQQRINEISQQFSQQPSPRSEAMFLNLQDAQDALKHWEPGRLDVDMFQNRHPGQPPPQSIHDLSGEQFQTMMNNFAPQPGSMGHTLQTNPTMQTAWDIADQYQQESWSKNDPATTEQQWTQWRQDATNQFMGDIMPELYNESDTEMRAFMDENMSEYLPHLNQDNSGPAPEPSK